MPLVTDTNLYLFIYLMIAHVLRHNQRFLINADFG